MKVEDVKLICEELGIRPTKTLGQNFLINDSVCQKIIKATKVDGYPQVIEIGPGLGALTRLMENVKDKLLLIELDKKLSNYWDQKKFQVHHQDAMKFDWIKHCNVKTVLVSNLPYQISSSIVIELSTIKNIERMVLMFQKEVAQRIMASPKNKNYGFLSVVAQSFWDVKKVVDVSASSFFPPPKIESRVLEFERLKIVDLSNPFVEFVKRSFSQRRKFLIKNLSGSIHSNEKLNDIFVSLNISTKVRAEELSPIQFQNMYKELFS
jgi:16S rRNA (adenine1518-N6/adenine1519-N6)-dimethyltransferase